MLKCINPSHTYFWKYPKDESVVFEFRAKGGPSVPTSTEPSEVISQTISQYLDTCIVSVTNIEIPIEGEFRKFEKWEGSPKVKWSSVLPIDVANALWVEISKVTHLTEDEKLEQL